MNLDRDAAKELKNIILSITVFKSTNDFNFNCEQDQAGERGTILQKHSILIHPEYSY